MPPVVSLNNILVLQGDSFKLSVEHLVLQPGLIYALTGANGSGKSTLLRVMALLTPPFEGTIEFSGNKTNNPARQRQKVTLVEQSPYLFKGKVIDNLSYGLKLRGIDNNERIRRITTTLANVGLEGFEQRQAKELSGGEIQRVALARALALKPELLLLDEPTANIDSSSLQGYEALLRDLPKYGVTVVFSTHDPSQSQRLGDQVLHLDN
ncbi:MAG: energy-coupling factor ABC transporter ATP-binding protein, partial [Desulfuromonadales bacterium]|nr:energy-coupling factor ABC transporter ATP-binding protein [Desulfuromonadales bacterium]